MYICFFHKSPETPKKDLAGKACLVENRFYGSMEKNDNNCVKSS